MQVTNLAQPSPGVQAPLGAKTAVNNNAVPISTTAASAADTLSLSSNKIVIAQQVVTQQVEIALEIKTPVFSAPQSSNTVQGQANQLANTVIQTIHQEAAENSDDISDEDKHSAAVKSVQIKVTQGFSNATFALNQLGLTDNSVNNTVDQTRATVNAAIDQAAGQATGSATGPTTNPATAPADGSSTLAPVETIAFNNVNATRELSSSLQLTTNDGDVVTVNFSRSQSLSAGGVAGSEGSLAYAGAASSSSINFSVQGDLSEDESESIQKVVESISKLAEKLFDGKTGAAMEKLGDLNINTEYLADMSLNMSSSITYKAMSAYAQVSNLPTDGSAATTASTANGPAIAATPVASSAPQTNASNTTANQTSTAATTASGSPAVTGVPAESAAATVQQATLDTVNVVNETVAAETFDDPFKELKNLFSQIANLFAPEQGDTGDDHKDFVSKLFDNIVDKIEDNHGKDHDNDDDASVSELAA